MATDTHGYSSFFYEIRENPCKSVAKGLEILIPYCPLVAFSMNPASSLFIFFRLAVGR